MLNKKFRWFWTYFVAYFCYFCNSCYFCYPMKFLLYFLIFCYQMKCPGILKIYLPQFFWYSCYSPRASWLKYEESIWMTLYLALHVDLFENLKRITLFTKHHLLLKSLFYTKLRRVILLKSIFIRTYLKTC